MTRKAPLFIGTAAWSIPAAERPHFADGPSVLHRYASRFDAVEINSSFYRPHRRKTYERWADSVGPYFRFAVKTPKTITHEKRLIDCHAEMQRFAHEAGGLGSKLGPILIQLPPSLTFDAATALPILETLTGLFEAPIVCEPRHKSWFSDAVDDHLQRLGVTRAAADPFILPEANQPGGDRTLTYLRLHGSPEIYVSDYSQADLDTYAARLQAYAAESQSVWCIFDNTSLGHATANALQMTQMLAQRPL